MTYILTFFIIYLVFILIAYLGQRRLVYYPTSDFAGTPKDAGLSYEDVELKTNDGVNIHGWYIPNEKSEDVLLFFHGNGGNISHRIDLIDIYYKAGLSVFIFDYRGYGKSEGKPSEKGTYKDADAAWDFLVQKKKFKAQNIIVLGRSLGGGIGSYITLKNKPKALILDSAFTSMPDMAKKVLPIFPTGLFPIYQYPNLKRLKLIKCTVLIMHSSEDSLIPFRMGQELFKKANEPKKFVELKGTHDDSFLVSMDKYKKGIEDFLKIL